MFAVEVKVCGSLSAVAFRRESCARKYVASPSTTLDKQKEWKPLARFNQLQPNDGFFEEKMKSFAFTGPLTALIVALAFSPAILVGTGQRDHAA